MWVIGHRGCRGILPENTITGFIEAIKLGVHAIELDVVVSGDNKIVVSHEPFMSRTTCLLPCGNEIPEEQDQKINLFNLTYKEIKEYDCGLKKHPKFPEQQDLASYKPLLTDVVASCEKFTSQQNIKPISYIIEIKSKPLFYNIFYPNPREYVSLLLDELKLFPFRDRLVLKSFDISILNEINRQSPLTKTSLLINRDELIEEKLGQLLFKPEIIGPYFQLLSDNIIDMCKRDNFLLFPWTINETSDMKKVIDFGIDGFITDYPNRLLSIL